MSKVKEISDTNFQEEISQGVNLIDFNAVWCPPCQMMKPILAHLSENPEFATVGFKSLDVDHNPAIAQQLQIQGIPTFILTKDGKIVDRITGFIPEPALAQRIKQYL